MRMMRKEGISWLNWFYYIICWMWTSTTKNENSRDHHYMSYQILNVKSNILIPYSFFAGILRTSLNGHFSYHFIPSWRVHRCDNKMSSKALWHFSYEQTFFFYFALHWKLNILCVVLVYSHFILCLSLSIFLVLLYFFLFLSRWITLDLSLSLSQQNTQIRESHRFCSFDEVLLSATDKHI